MDIGSPTRARTWDLRINRPALRRSVSSTKSIRYLTCARYILDEIRGVVAPCGPLLSLNRPGDSNSRHQRRSGMRLREKTRAPQDTSEFRHILHLITSLEEIVRMTRRTISREIKRNGGKTSYRTSQADQSAWDRGRRPKTGKLTYASRPCGASASSSRLFGPVLWSSPSQRRPQSRPCSQPYSLR
jgi:hypothetical protein